MKKKILFIINPHSGIGKYKKVEKTVEEFLDKQIFEPHFCNTEYSGHARDLSTENQDNFEIIVAVGGDGSVNEVSQGLIHKKTVLGVIPSGSGNGFARFLNISRNTISAVKIINQLNIKQVDTIKINNNHFVNIAGIGFDAEIAHKFAKTKRRGFFPYAKLILDDIMIYTPEKFTLVIDGEKIDREVFFIVFANSSQWGFGAEISPFSKIDDGLLNICLFHKFPILEAPFLTGKLFDKTILNSRHCENYTAKEVKIISSKPQIYAHLDGEPIIFEPEINIKVEPLSLNVIVSEKFTKKRRFF
jgi:YegS/Rv2252/BmrU family lipid kinase